MTPALLYSPDREVRSQINQSLDRFTSYTVIDFLGDKLLQHSYYWKPSYWAKTFHQKGILNSKAMEYINAQSSPTGINWDKVAALDGLPESIPVSKWALETIEKQRVKMIGTVWSQKLVDNLSAISGCIRDGRPGNYQPALLQGPSGASKTFAVTILGNLIGRPIMLINGESKGGVSASIRLLRGGNGPSGTSQISLMEHRASHGVFETLETRQAYYRRINILVQEGRASDFLDAHSIIQEDQWKDLSRLDQIPEDPKLAAKLFGKAEVARQNGAIVLFDEANKFDEGIQSEMEGFFNSYQDNNPTNTCYIMATNPPSAAYPDRKRFSKSIMDRSTMIDVAPFSRTDFQNHILGSIGGDGTDLKVQYRGKEESISKLIKKTVTQKGIAPDGGVLSSSHVEKIMPNIGGKALFSEILTNQSKTQIAEKIADIHMHIDSSLNEGGSLNPATHYIERDENSVSIRSLNKLLNSVDAHYMSEVYDVLSSGKSIEENFTNNQIVEIVGESLSRGVEDTYIRPFGFSYNSKFDADDLSASKDAPQSGSEQVREYLDRNFSGPATKGRTGTWFDHSIFLDMEDKQMLDMAKNVLSKVTTYTPAKEDLIKFSKSAKQCAWGEIEAMHVNKDKSVVIQEKVSFERYMNEIYTKGLDLLVVGDGASLETDIGHLALIKELAQSKNKLQIVLTGPIPGGSKQFTVLSGNNSHSTLNQSDPKKLFSEFDSLIKKDGYLSFGPNNGKFSPKDIEVTVFRKAGYKEGMLIDWVTYVGAMTSPEIKKNQPIVESQIKKAANVIS